VDAGPDRRSHGVSVGLLGSGEFEPWTDEVDRWLLDRASGDGTVLILPAASAPEGDSVFEMWATMGLTHYGRLGIPAEVVPLKTRPDAERPVLAKRLSSASMAYFSGGNPAYLAGILQGTVFWSELLTAMARGMAYTGCSAGIACLGEVAPDSAVRDFASKEIWKPGLRLFPRTQLGPHWDALDTYLPGLRRMIVSAVPDEWRLVGVDENTAMVGDGTQWQVLGSGAVHLWENGEWHDVAAGASFTRPFEIALAPSEPSQA
jgi:cyanophycinase-like exopeptidase